MKYTRVIPRDLFNEAKLLKCMGRLCLNILDYQVPVPMKSEHNGDPFEIRMTICGSLVVANLKIFIGETFVAFGTTVNSKSNYPLHAMYNDCEYEVFNDDGEYTEEFIEFCEEITT